MELFEEIYSGGYFSIVRKFEQRQTPWMGLEHVLPDKNNDLVVARDSQVAPLTEDTPDFEKEDIRSKYQELRREFTNRSELLFLHALCIAILRRRDAPEHVNDLFFRMWHEQGAFLADNTDVRWKISAATTFADHGRTLEQRSLGMGLSILFDTIKLHDSERRLSGKPGRRPFKKDYSIKRHRLAFDMNGYSFKKGDLDRNMLARLWKISEQDPTIMPLARSMLFLIMSDNRSIFARVQRLKRKYKTSRNDSVFPDNLDI